MKNKFINENCENIKKREIIDLHYIHTVVSRRLLEFLLIVETWIINKCSGARAREKYKKKRKYNISMYPTAHCTITLTILFHA